jgi:hypothetical protein
MKTNRKSDNNGKFTAENARKMQARGAEVRREKSAERKSAKEFAQMALNAEVTDKSTGRKVIVKDAIIQKLITKAIQGTDLNTVKYLFELIGENPAQRMEITGADGKDLVPNKPLSKSEMKKLIQELENE